MNTFWLVLPLALDKPPRPEDVKQGWIGFVVFIALAVAVVLLWLSFRKQLKKVDFDEDAGREPAERPGEQSPEEPRRENGSTRS